MQDPDAARGNSGCGPGDVRRWQLPPAPTAFRWRHEPWGDVLECQPLAVHAQHAFSTRQLQLHAPDMEQAWALITASINGSVEQLVRIRQVHGTNVHVVREADLTDESLAARPEADAVATKAPGAVLAVQVADCVPMLMVDARTGAVAAVHAGWRGTAAGIARATVAVLARTFAARPSDLLVALGPSIGPCCYEVGNELIAAFRAAGAGEDELRRWFSRTAEGSLRLDLWRANHDQLVDAGVAAEAIHVSRLCTQTHSDVFHSYRVAGPRAGRIIAAIAVPAGTTRPRR